MNNELEKLLQDVLSTSGTYDKEKGELVKKEVISMYNKKLKLWRYIVWGLLVIDTIIIMTCVNIFSSSSDVKVLIGSAAILLLTFEGSVLMKLWYWQMDTKFSVVKEIAEVKLQIAQMCEKNNEIDS